MKKILFNLIAILLCVTLVGCGSKDENGDSGSDGKAPKFSGNYVYNLPTDNYYVETEGYIKAKVGNKYTYREKGDNAWNYHINSDYENIYVYYQGEWVIDSNYAYSEYKDSYLEIYPLSAMEDYFMRYFRQYGFEDEKLEEYYVGNEKVAGVDCWIFDTKGLNAIYMKYWVDPSNGATLKMVDYSDGTEEVYEVIKYDINYKEMDSNLYPSSYEGLKTW